MKFMLYKKFTRLTFPKNIDKKDRHFRNFLEITDCVEYQLPWLIIINQQPWLVIINQQPWLIHDELIMVADW